MAASGPADADFGCLSMLCVSQVFPVNGDYPGNRVFGNIVNFNRKRF